MTYSEVILEKGDDHVAQITLNRPDQMNTFNTGMAGELYSALMDAESDKNVRCKRGIGDCAPYFPHKVKICLPGVPPIHCR